MVFTFGGSGGGSETATGVVGKILVFKLFPSVASFSFNTFLQGPT